MRANIAIDIDTISLHLLTEVWNKFVPYSQSKGCNVFFVTSLSPQDESVQNIGKHIEGKLYCTAGSPMSWYLANRGIRVDSWVTGSPELIGDTAKWNEKFGLELEEAI